MLGRPAASRASLSDEVAGVVLSGAASVESSARADPPKAGGALSGDSAPPEAGAPEACAALSLARVGAPLLEEDTVLSVARVSIFSGIARRVAKVPLQALVRRRSRFAPGGSGVNAAR